VGEPVAWLGLLDSRPDDAAHAAPVTERGEAAGWLVAWRRVPGAGSAVWRRPARDAVRCPASIVGEGEGPWEVSLSMPVRRERPLHDDPAVVAAARAAARDGGRLALTAALVADEVRWAGGISAVDVSTAEAWPGWASLDPWARLCPARRLRVGVGVLRAAPLPPSPGTQRRRGAPWPSGTF
jgi:hypothetical protein